MRIILFILLLTPLAWSQSDPHTRQAMKKTTEVLTNKKERAEAVGRSQRAYEADLKARNLMGTPENTEALYGLSNNIMEMLVEKTGGDPEKLQQLIIEAQSDPKKFYESFTPQQKAEIKRLGEILERGPASGTGR